MCLEHDDEVQSLKRKANVIEGKGHIFHQNSQQISKVVLLQNEQYERTLHYYFHNSTSAMNEYLRSCSPGMDLSHADKRFPF